MNEQDIEDSLMIAILILAVICIIAFAACPKAHSQQIPASAQAQIQTAATAAHQSVHSAAQNIINAYTNAGVPMNSAGYVQSLGIAHIKQSTPMLHHY